jgi:hypothetical protein
MRRATRKHRLADVYFSRGQAVLLDHERTKRQTSQQRRLIHQQHAA